MQLLGITYDAEAHFYLLYFLAVHKEKSGKRGSNPRPSAWEADALPTELLPHICNMLIVTRRKVNHIFGITQNGGDFLLSLSLGIFAWGDTYGLLEYLAEMLGV